MALKFQMDLFNPRIKTEEMKINKSNTTTTTTTSPEITSSASSMHSTTSLTKSSASSTPPKSKSKLTSLFTKKSTPPPTPEEEAKTKEMIMKYRNMTSEEADAYLAEKKNGDGLGTERGLRAVGMAFAPIRL